jgi:hypothetical protein
VLNPFLIPEQMATVTVAVLATNRLGHLFRALDAAPS